MPAHENRSRRIRDPLIGINRRTAKGREVRDLYAPGIAAIEEVIDGDPDATLQAAVRRAMELRLLCERFRFTMLNATKLDIGDLEQIVRVENMVARADRNQDLGGNGNTITRSLIVAKFVDALPLSEKILPATLPAGHLSKKIWAKTWALLNVTPLGSAKRDTA